MPLANPSFEALAAALHVPLLRRIRDSRSLESVAMYREYQFDWLERVCIDAILDAERLGAPGKCT